MARHKTTLCCEPLKTCAAAGTRDLMLQHCQGDMASTPDNHRLQRRWQPCKGGSADITPCKAAITFEVNELSGLISMFTWHQRVTTCRIIITDPHMLRLAKLSLQRVAVTLRKQACKSKFAAPGISKDPLKGTAKAKRRQQQSHLFKGSRPTSALDLTRDVLPGDSLAVQLASSDELVYSALGSGVEVPHDHAQGVVVALAHNVVHDVQQGPQLSNLHATWALSISCK